MCMYANAALFSNVVLINEVLFFVFFPCFKNEYVEQNGAE